jgi:hypothetical protein
MEHVQGGCCLPRVTEKTENRLMPSDNGLFVNSMLEAKLMMGGEFSQIWGKRHGRISEPTLDTCRQDILHWMNIGITD